MSVRVDQPGWAGLALVGALACGKVAGLDDFQMVDQNGSGGTSADASGSGASGAGGIFKDVQTEAGSAGVASGAGGSDGCSSGAAQCVGQVPQLCNQNGQWVSGVACQNQACVNGVCQGVCEPGTKHCSGNSSQDCDPSGQWSLSVPCGTNNYCSAGVCSPCPGTGGPVMVGMPQGYCIDSTEVTASQYSAWRASGPSTAALPAYCTSWKSSFNVGTGTGDYPIASVDWCDAYGYCKAVGKRLCGRIGGGANSPDAWASAALSQWFNACSAFGENHFVYGNTYEAQTCNGKDHSSAAVPVGSLTGCQSSVEGYAGVYDLTGNLREWEDSCDKEVDHYDTCRFRGGSFKDADIYLTCGVGYIEGIFRDTLETNLGFRCCAP